jgi:3-deoxy-7-phosphoheptulonate synthase
MMIVTKPGVTEADLDELVRVIERNGARAHLSRGQHAILIGVVGRTEDTLASRLGALETVERVIPIVRPYKLAALEARIGEASVIAVGGRKIGGAEFAIIAGPCAIESRDVLLESAIAVRDAGADLLRAGAYKPRTSPYSFQGLGAEGLALLTEAKETTSLPVVTELLDVRDLAAVANVADVIQVGARNMQNYTLLAELGQTDVPVLLKRGISATIEELLLAAEYVMNGGNERVILCERGIRTFETNYRFTLDLTAIPALKELTHLPVVVDPSHAAGRHSLVEPLSMAAAAVGADGVIVEIHPRPAEAVCDGPQAIVADRFADYVRRVQAIAAAARATTEPRPSEVAA